MSVSRVLPNILYGKFNFCCFCLNETNLDAINIDDDISSVDSESPITMSVIINTIFGDYTLDTVATFGMFCNPCTITAINTYKFIKTCKDSNSSLVSAIGSIKESFENTLPDIDSYKSLCVSIDLDDFTSKQFYDDKSLNSLSNVSQRINTLTNVISKGIKGEPFITNSNSSKKKSLKGGKKAGNINRKTLTFDIPNFPTEFMLADLNSEPKCKVCFKRFVAESMLRKHFFRKHFPREVKCVKCPRRFISEEMLKQHEAFTHEGICKECGKHFTNKSVLKKHEQNHNFQITCSDCGRLYHSKEAFKKHITDDVCSQKMRKTAEQAVYECDHCQKRYCYKFYLAKHIMHEHGNKEGFRCEYCNKNFYTQSRLKTHLVKHTREKNFMCTLCKKNFVTRESLIYHTRLHTGETPYKCDYCDQAFLNASRRLDHVRRHHLPPGFECDICHTKFKASTSLLKHRKRHMLMLPAPDVQK